MFTIEEAREILRLDGDDNDEIIYPLVSAIPPYLEATTGYCPADGNYSPLAITAGGSCCSYGITARTATQTSCSAL